MKSNYSKFNMLIIVFLWIISHKLCICDHILVTAITASYGHWNTLLHISKELLSRNTNHFITFLIDEHYDYYLNTITDNERYNKDSYQIIYTPNEQQIDFQKFQENNVQIHDGLIKQATISFISKAIFLNNSQLNPININELNISYLDSLINYNLQHKH
eukprot:23583_1